MHRFPLPLFGFILVLACASNAESQTDKVRVAISSISTSQVNVWVPFDTGFFKKHGLDVELVYISGAPIGAAALMSGKSPLAKVASAARLPAICAARELTSSLAAPTVFPTN